MATKPLLLRKLLTICLGHLPRKAFTVDLDVDDTVSCLRSIIAASTPHAASDLDLYVVKPGASLLVDDPRISAFVASVKARQVLGTGATGSTLRADPEEVEQCLPVIWLRDPSDLVAPFLKPTDEVEEGLVHRKELRFLASLDGRLESAGSMGGSAVFRGVPETLPPPAYGSNDGAITDLKIPVPVTGLLFGSQSTSVAMNEKRRSCDMTHVNADSTVGVSSTEDTSTVISPDTSHAPETTSTMKTQSSAEKSIPLVLPIPASAIPTTPAEGFLTVHTEDTTGPSDTAKEDHEKDTRKKKTRLMLILICLAVVLVILALILAIVLALKKVKKRYSAAKRISVWNYKCFHDHKRLHEHHFFHLGLSRGKFCEISFSSRLETTTSGVCRKSESHQEAIHGIVPLSSNLLATVDQFAVVFWDLSAGVTEKKSDTITLNFTQYIPADVNASTSFMYIRSATPAPDNGAVFIISNLLDSETGPFGGVVLFLLNNGGNDSPYVVSYLRIEPSSKPSSRDDAPWCAVLADPTRLFVGLAGGLIVEYKRGSAAAQWNRTAAFKAHEKDVRVLEVARKNRWLLSAGHDGMVKVWDLDAMPSRDLAGSGSLQMPVAKYSLIGRQGSAAVDHIVTVGIREDECEIGYGFSNGTGINETGFFVHRLPQRGEFFSSDSLRWSAELGYPTWHVLHSPGQKPWLIYGGENKKPQLWQEG
ncbi:hypothetical protein HDU96_006160 [Phlyctochytrium bullatum]|nr:hypothetical protein HDU96_006160 [Phlyctochytrium bullatum]